MRLTRNNVIVLMTLSLMAPLGAMAEEAHEQHLTIDELPSPVRATVVKLANGQRVGEIEKESERGKVVYKVKIGENEITLHANGRVLSMKTERSEKGKHDEKEEKEHEEKEGKEHEEKERLEKEGKERQ